MPATTYFNLPEEKKERIMEAALDEFAAYSFSAASINRIVKAARIPRGSFYQYFSDKEDLYMLVMEKIGKEKLEVYARHPAPSEDATFFEAAVASMPAIVEWAEKSPRYNRIGMLMARDDSEFMQRVIGQMKSPQRSVLTYLQQDQRRGLVRGDIDPELVLQMLLPAISSLLREYYTEGGRDAALERIRKMFDILENGINTKEASHGGDSASGREAL